MGTNMANPFVTGPAETQTTAADLPEFVEFDYDFEKDKFKINADGSHQFVWKNEAIKVWVLHTLRVERYRYLAYFDDYGIELDPFVGTGPNDSQRASELYQYIKEGMLVNPYILGVTAVSTVRDGKKITMTLDLDTVYGSTSVGIEV